MAADFKTALTAEIAHLEAELQADVRYLRLKHLYGIAELYDATIAPPASAVQPFASVALPRKPPTRKIDEARARALAESEKFVRSVGRVVPTKEIYAHISAIDGIELHGGSPQNNLSAMLSKSGRFVSHGRAGWTIKESPEGEGAHSRPLADEDDEAAERTQPER